MKRRALTKLRQEEDDSECWWDVFIEEILPRLPAKQLQTLKIVCKNWNRIISSPTFVGLHLNVYNQSQIRVVIKQSLDLTIWYCNYNINSLDIEESNARIPTAIGVTKIMSVILGSCDGLLCLLLVDYDYNWKIAVYNPSTGKYLIFEIPYDFLDRNWSWFGRHPSSGKYVLVMLNSDRKIGVYKFSTSNLKLIHLSSSSGTFRQFSVDSGDYSGTLLHGAVHWPTRWIYDEDDASRPRHSISAYHLDHNKWFEISLPVQDQGPHFKLGVVDGCLFAILRPSIDADAEFEVWIMKEYGIQQSWTKYANIHGFAIYKSLSPLGFLPNGDLILNVDYELYKYSFNDNKHAILMNRRYGIPIMCADSLVSPTIVVAVE